MKEIDRRLQGDRPGHPPPGRPRGRGEEGRRAHARPSARPNSERRRVKRGLPPERQPGEGRVAGDRTIADDDRFDGVEV